MSLVRSLPMFAAATMLLAAPPAAAQVFLEGFAGRSLPEARSATLTAADARVDDTQLPVRLRVGIDRLDITDSTIFGARLGYWHGVFGVAVDAASLDTDVRAQTVRASANLRFDEEVFGERVTIDPGESLAVSIPRIGIPTTATIAALAMVRLPRGGIQPYAFAGPAYLVTDTDISGDWGLRAGGGARLALSRHFGLFGEYRYTHVNATAEAGRVSGSVGGIEGDSGVIDAGLRLRDHSIVGGLSIFF